jgi:hypothetical protein
LGFAGCKYYAHGGVGFLHYCPKTRYIFHLQKTFHENNISSLFICFPSSTKGTVVSCALNRYVINIFVICSWFLQTYCMIHGPRLWLLVLSVSAFSLCYRAQRWRLVSKLLRFKSCFVCSTCSIKHSYIYTVMVCSNVLLTTIVMWRTVGVADLPRRQDGGSMMTRFNSIMYLSSVYNKAISSIYHGWCGTGPGKALSGHSSGNHFTFFLARESRTWYFFSLYLDATIRGLQAIYIILIKENNLYGFSLYYYLIRHLRPSTAES